MTDKNETVMKLPVKKEDWEGVEESEEDEDVVLLKIGGNTADMYTKILSTGIPAMLLEKFFDTIEEVTGLKK